jgi:hypothetical protein
MVFWDVEPCRLVGLYRRFKCAYCLHHLGDTSQKILKLHTRRRENLKSHKAEETLKNSIRKEIKFYRLLEAIFRDK